MTISSESRLPTKFILFGSLLILAAMGSPAAQSQGMASERAERFRRMSQEAEARGLAETFKGVTRDGQILPGLFAVRSSGVSTEPVRQAASAFLAVLSTDQRAKTLFPVDDDEWRKWMNQHFYVRQGVSLAEMSEVQRQAAIDLLRASLSAKGLQQSQDIMRLNHTLGELNGNNFEEYGEGRYWITLMGEPHASEPWGWQLDGHHLIINYFVMGDQVVMTPTFMGSEPVTATSGKYKGTAVLQREQAKGLALINALNDDQRKHAVLQTSKRGQNNVAEAFKDNVVLDYAGIRAADLSAAQKDTLLDLIQEHVANLRDGHAQVKMDEVRQHLDATHFAWIGETTADSVFYYRVQSPVILIEFDHQPHINMPGVDRGKPTRQHIHSIVRTPNGNDYGKDLLRQHYQQHPHPHRH
jgi:predicted nuclease of restriction endonuclease-like (RecB) superfamily